MHKNFGRPRTFTVNFDKTAFTFESAFALYVVGWSATAQS